MVGPPIEGEDGYDGGEAADEDQIAASVALARIWLGSWCVPVVSHSAG